MSKKIEIKDLLYFEVMLFPKIARICYYLLVGLSFLSGFVLFARGLGMDWGGEGVVLSGLFMMIIGPVLIRLWFEFMLIWFMIHKKLGDIHEKLGGFSGDITKSTNETVVLSCKGCKAAIEPNARFCNSCGLAVGEQES